MVRPNLFFEKLKVRCGRWRLLIPRFLIFCKNAFFLFVFCKKNTFCVCLLFFAYNSILESLNQAFDRLELEI